jgi:dihydropteroate synthase
LIDIIVATAMKSVPESNLFSTNRTLNIGGRLLDLRIPKVMGVLNVTPDSFYDGSRFEHEATILKQVGKMLEEGATMIDIGAYSSRPGAIEIPEKEELSRALGAITPIVREFPEAILSIDTFRSSVARAAVQEGVHMVNDISAGSLDPAMIRTVAELNVPYIAMHMRGTPSSMHEHTGYDDLMKDITDYFHERIQALAGSTVHDVIIDPGFGFAKTREQNFELLANLSYLKILGRPIMVGLSRKSMIWKTLSITPEDALNGTTCLHTLALLRDANILRVHDVREAVEVIRLIAETERYSGQDH